MCYIALTGGELELEGGLRGDDRELRGRGGSYTFNQECVRKSSCLLYFLLISCPLLHSNIRNASHKQQPLFTLTVWTPWDPH